jgi:hypothetical protein
MKRIQYRAVYQAPTNSASPIETVFEVYARSINSGFGKAAKMAVRACPARAEIVRVEFWQVP